MSAQELEATAKALVAPGKGILAIDESLPSINTLCVSSGFISDLVRHPTGGVGYYVDKLRRRVAAVFVHIHYFDNSPAKAKKAVNSSTD